MLISIYRIYYLYRQKRNERFKLSFQEILFQWDDIENFKNNKEIIWLLSNLKWMGLFNRQMRTLLMRTARHSCWNQLAQVSTFSMICSDWRCMTVFSPPTSVFNRYYYKKIFICLLSLLNTSAQFVFIVMHICVTPLHACVCWRSHNNLLFIVLKITNVCGFRKKITLCCIVNNILGHESTRKNSYIIFIYFL